MKESEDNNRPNSVSGERDMPIIYIDGGQSIITSMLALGLQTSLNFPKYVCQSINPLLQELLGFCQYYRSNK